MKYIIVAFALLCSSCGTINNQLKEAISYGEIKELNNYSPEIDKQLIVRLFEYPVYTEHCFKETQGICQYNYFLSVSTYDEQPETNVYSLDVRGEIQDTSWQAIEAIDTAKINFTINKYTQDALNNNSNLVNEKRNVLVVVTPKSILTK